MQLHKLPCLLIVGMVSQLGPMYLLEIVPYNLKGAFGTACQLFCTIGIFMGGVFGLREILGKNLLARDDNLLHLYCSERVGGWVEFDSSIDT